MFRFKHTLAFHHIRTVNFYVLDTFMISRYKTYLLQIITTLVIIALAAACANIGNPTGGARDEDPPVFISADPNPGSLNVNKTKITLNFNELINVKDAFQKVVVSPPSRQVPKVASIGKRVTVTFDSLLPNTTYTIDFANSIEDNNEGNKLEGFAYTFSTGENIDSLRISGMVLDSHTLEPQQGILVGVLENLSDTAFSKIPFTRVAKTDDLGRFTIRGLRDTIYNVFALNDLDNDYRYANPEEDIAFHPYKVRPYYEKIETFDTTYTKLGEIDTVTTRFRTRFLPNDILLRTFNSQKRPQYLTKYERLDSTKVFFKFNTRSNSLPEISIACPVGKEFKNVVLERNPTNDSLVFWLPENLVREDSLRLAATYLRTDSAGLLTEFSDTLRFYTNKPKIPKKKKKEEEKIKISAEDSIKNITLGIKFLSTVQEVNLPAYFEFDTPLAKMDTGKFHLEMMVDTIWKPVPKPYRVSQRDSVSPRHFKLVYPWEYETKYRIIGDTIAAIGIYGKPTRPAMHEFTTKKEDEYCSITFNIHGEDESLPLFVELLSGNDNIARIEPVVNNRVSFKYLAPGKYYARIVEDYNGNGEYDTGDYERMLQPELAYYYPKAINIKKNWDKEEDWDVFVTAIDLMKPAAIKKNKPERKKLQRNEGVEPEEEEETFDPTANPFDPNRTTSRKTGSY